MSKSGGIGFLGVLFCIFLLLKLGIGHTAVEGWSWWWIFAPFWIPILLVIIALVICVFVGIKIFK